MKKCKLLFAVFLIFILTFQVNAYDINAKSYIIIDAKTGKTLYSMNADTAMWPASITKVMTSALALEKFETGDSIEMTDAAVFSVPRDTSHIALTPGERVPIKDLLNATMIQSANEAANGLAEYVSGDIASFVDLMNKKAAEVGAVKTNFKNPNGLYDSGHVTTARDMAAITRWALSVDGFREIFGTKTYTMGPTNIQKDERNFWTKNQLMSGSYYNYDGNIGGKTGWTPESGHTLTTLTKRGDLELILVLMDTTTTNQLYKDATYLLDRAFEEYEMTTVPFSSLPLSEASLSDGEKTVGSISFEGQDLTFPKKKSVSEQELTVRLAVKESYLTSDEIRPQAVVVDAEGSELYRQGIGYDVKYHEVSPQNALQVIGRKSASVSDKPLPKSVLHYLVVSIVFVTGMTVLYNFRAYKKAKELERRRAYRRRSHKGA